MKEMRFIYVVYDIQDDNIRNTLSNLLLYYGLHRVQYSAFKGLIPVKDKYSLLKEIYSLNIGKEDKIHIFDLCKSCLENAITIGKIEEGKEHIVL